MRSTTISVILCIVYVKEFVQDVENCKRLLTTRLHLCRFSHVGKSSITTSLTSEHTLPPNVYIAPSGFEAELVTRRQRVKEINASHELVRFNNDWPGNCSVCVFWIFTLRWFNSSKKRKVTRHLSGFVVTSSYNDVVLVCSKIH